MLLKSKSDAVENSDAAAGEVMHSAGDGHVTDASSSKQSWNRGDESISSDSECTNHRRLDVTRAPSECSMTDDDDDDDDGLLRSMYGVRTQSSWCAGDLKMEMDVLEAEYTLLRVRKELALPNTNKGCIERNDAVNKTQINFISCVHPIPMEGGKKGDQCSAFYKIEPKVTAPNLSEDMGDILYSDSRFAREAFGRLQDISVEIACPMLQEDPTFALQDRLQKLLRAAVLDHECPVHSGFKLASEDAWNTSNRFGTAAVEKDTIPKEMSKDARYLNDSAANTKELDSRSSKNEQAKVALASQKEEHRSRFGRHSQQTLAEEMYCKETIRRIVKQVQAEIEQWSQMQNILHNLQGELEDLSELQKLWENRALRAEAQLKCLQEEVHEWRCRARSSEEELVLLRFEMKILKNQLDMIEDGQMNPSAIVGEVQEKPECASVGTQHENYAACESFVHSRNESGRSSVDLGTSTQRSFRKSLKKSLDFVNSNKISSSNSSKFLFGNLGLLPTKGEPTKLEFSSKKVDVLNSKGKSKTSGHFMKLNATKLDSSESTYGHDHHKERKKARLLASKENRSLSASDSALNPSVSENAQDGFFGHVINAGQDYTSGLFSTKLKSSWPSAPASTPSRIPFGDLNKHVKN